MNIVRQFTFLLLLLSWAALAVSPASAQDAPGPFVYGHADLSSPRTTLETFLSTSGSVAKLILDTYRQRQDETGLFPSPAMRVHIEQAELLIDTAARTLDLSQVPPAVVEHQKIELVLQLKEVLDRVGLATVNDIPDAAALEASARTGSPVAHWRLPGTELILVQIDEGTRKGDFVFSAGSVSRISALYEASLAFPSRADSEDVYQLYSTTPGRLVPPLWYEYVRNGPAWLDFAVADQAIWQWLALAAWTLLATGIIVWTIRRRWSRDKSQGTILEEARQALLPLLIVVLSGFFLFEVIDQINLTGIVYLLANAAHQVLLAFGLAWLIVLICQTAAEVIIRSPAILPDSLDAHLLRAGFRIIGLMLGLLLLGYTATRLGLPLLGVLAGLGVGGLAIALAAQPTIENFIGGVILFADRPVRMGEFCRCGDVMGTVEEIGLRSTRIRALDRTLVSIPNAEFAKARIINFSRRDYQLLETKFGVRFEASRAELEQLLAALRGLIASRPHVMSDTVRVRMGTIGDSALEVDIRAYFQIADLEEFLAEKEELLLSIMELVDDAGCGFAYPTQAVYFARDVASRSKSLPRGTAPATGERTA